MKNKIGKESENLNLPTIPNQVECSNVVVQNVEAIEKSFEQNSSELARIEKEIEELKKINRNYQQQEQISREELQIKIDVSTALQRHKTHLIDQVDAFKEVFSNRNNHIVDKEAKVVECVKEMNNDFLSMLNILDIAFSIKQETVLNKTRMLYEFVTEGVAVVIRHHIDESNNMELIKITPCPERFDDIRIQFAKCCDLRGLLASVRKWAGSRKSL